MKRKKIFSAHRLAKIVSSLKKKGKAAVFTNGCFDILHVGHVSYLNKAKQLGDILIVAVNSDSSVKSIKAKNRPINTLKDRMKIISCLESVDYVCSFNESTPLSLIKKIVPSVLVKGADWKKKDVIGADFVKNNGGRVVCIKLEKGHSTTKLIRKIVAL
ncbi:D-glycero-beta-D-manno-heptose 1-phosphate adenylyltransferase [Candidatus Omnitrophota bacterium]